MKSRTSKSPRPAQHTLRRVPPAIDSALRRKSRRDGKSLNETALEVLSQALAINGEIRHTDLDFMIGSWVSDPAFDQAIKEQSKIDRALWK